MVQFFCLLSVVIGLYLSSFFSIVVCLTLNAIALCWVWQKILAIHPDSGVIILEHKQIRFENENVKIQGQITPKTIILNTSVWLHIKGFNKRQWLIISANSVNNQSYARLKRAALIAINGEEESK
ncbi:protein YgfX [Pseudoalteromonas sp. P1-13-1a]|uniref:protein YgfX n=1 Tax=Pseudoalteromonas sp. P1-13-1a TaxID=1723756 RepID=UPI002E14FEC8